jgi:hypothetical protein
MNNSVTNVLYMINKKLSRKIENLQFLCQNDSTILLLWTGERRGESIFKFGGGKKQPERQTMQYWEDTSYMLGLVHPKCDYTLDENVFERIRNIGDVTLQARSLLSEENPGRLLISYHGDV